MKSFFKIYLFVFIIVFSAKSLNAQKMNFHFGANFNAVSRDLYFSHIGLKLYSNYLYYGNFNLRTNLSINYHEAKEVPEIPTTKDFFYTQIEESVIYQFDENFHNLFSGIGIGYYSLNTNTQSAHFHQIDSFNSNEWVGHEGFDSNFGFHFLIGKDFGPVILEIKYCYATFPYHIKYLGTIESNYVDQIVSRKYAFHFLEFSVSI